MSRVFGFNIGFGNVLITSRCFDKFWLLLVHKKHPKGSSFISRRLIIKYTKMYSKAISSSCVNLLYCERKVQRFGNSMKARKVPNTSKNKWCQLQMLEKRALKCQCDSPKRQSVTNCFSRGNGLVVSGNQAKPTDLHWVLSV